MQLCEIVEVRNLADAASEECFDVLTAGVSCATSTLKRAICGERCFLFRLFVPTPSGALEAWLGGSQKLRERKTESTTEESKNQPCSLYSPCRS